MTQPATGRGRASTRRRTTSSPRADFASRTEPNRAGSARAEPSRAGSTRSEPGRNGRPASAGGRGRGPRATTGSASAKTPRAALRGAESALDAALAEALARPEPAISSFAELGLPALLVHTLKRRGLERPFAIQTRTLPDSLAGRDVLGRAATGSGKTLAFGLAILTRLAGTGEHLAGRTGVDSSRPDPRRVAKSPRSLILVPTRELAVQVAGELTPLAGPLGLRVASVVGGAPYGRQIDALTRGVDILIATPGRLVDLIDRGAARLDKVEISVLDEADYMADLGFLPVVTRLLGLTPDGAQRLLFSATLDRGVATLVERFLPDPVVHAVAPATAAVSSMIHRVFVVGRDDKIAVAAEVAGRPARTLFFVRTKHGADRLAKQLGRAGVSATAIHGNRAQNARQRALTAFAEGSTRVLVATDVAARGIHVDGVDLVVHYDPPADPKAYLHRSGRTARAGNDGTVVTLAQTDQLAAVHQMHHEAKVTAEIENVHPGHRSVRAVAASGEPIARRR